MGEPAALSWEQANSSCKEPDVSTKQLGHGKRSRLYISQWQFGPRGFGHIGVMVPNVNDACARFERLGVEFVKKPTDGKMKGIAFIKDPDGYWIEIFNASGVSEIVP